MEELSLHGGLTVLCMLQAVEGGVCWLEVRDVMLCMLEAVEGELCLREVSEVLEVLQVLKVMPSATAESVLGVEPSTCLEYNLELPHSPYAPEQPTQLLRPSSKASNPTFKPLKKNAIRNHR